MSHLRGIAAGKKKNKPNAAWKVDVVYVPGSRHVAGFKNFTSRKAGARLYRELNTISLRNSNLFLEGFMLNSGLRCLTLRSEIFNVYVNEFNAPFRGLKTLVYQLQSLDGDGREVVLDKVEETLQICAELLDFATVEVPSKSLPEQHNFFSHFFSSVLSQLTCVLEPVVEVVQNVQNDPLSVFDDPNFDDPNTQAFLDQINSPGPGPDGTQKIKAGFELHDEQYEGYEGIWQSV